MRAGDDVSSLGRRVRDLVTRAPVTCGPALSGADIAHLMSRERVGCVVVVADGSTVGIVTDRDLRRKLIAEGRDARTTPASELMSSPVVSVPADAFVLDALVAMTRRGIHHLVVGVDHGLFGVVSSSDLLRLELPHPVALSRAIGDAQSLDGLKALASDVTQIVRRLVRAGVLGLRRRCSRRRAERPTRPAGAPRHHRSARRGGRSLDGSVLLASVRIRGQARTDPSDRSGQRPCLRGPGAR